MAMISKLIPESWVAQPARRWVGAKAPVLGQIYNKGGYGELITAREQASHRLPRQVRAAGVFRPLPPPPLISIEMATSDIDRIEFPRPGRTAVSGMLAYQ